MIMTDSCGYVNEAHLILESFCSTMLSLSSSLTSCRGARSTMATVRNQVSLLQLSRNVGRKGESVDICRNMSIAGLMNACKENIETSWIISNKYTFTHFWARVMHKYVVLKIYT